MAKGPTSRERSQETQPQDYATAYLAALLESTQDLIWSVDLNHHLVTSNKGLSDAFARRYDANMAAGITPRDLLLPENAAVFPPL
jgi:transcriptional regulator of aromatic amino acid metabolism